MKTCITICSASPRSPLIQLQDNLVDLDWKQANENVAVKLLAEDNQRYVLAKSKDRRAKERVMRNFWALLQVSWWTGRNNTLDSRTFVYGNYIDEVLLMCNLSGSNLGDCYYGHDPLYSPAVLITGTGVIAERYEYDVYATVKIWPGNDSYLPGLSPRGNPFFFTGWEWDRLDNGLLKLYYYRDKNAEIRKVRIVIG